MAYVPDLIPAAERERYVKGNMGKRVGWGARPALLVVGHGPRLHQVNLFDMDMKYADVTPLAEVLEKLR